MKRFIGILLAAVMMLGMMFTVASCSSKTGEKDLEKVNAAGKIVVGM